MENKTKICSCCKQELPVENFRKDSSRKDGVHPYCKKCMSEIAKKGRQTSEIAKEGVARRAKAYREKKKSGVEESQESLKQRRIEGLKEFHSKRRSAMLTVIPTEVEKEEVEG